MDEQTPPAIATPEQIPVGRSQFGWDAWASWVLALAAVGAFSYRLGAEAPLASFSLTPTAC